MRNRVSLCVASRRADLTGALPWADSRYNHAIMAKTILSSFVLFVAFLMLQAQGCTNKPTNPFAVDPNAHPPVTSADIRIVQRAKEILSTQSKWNRADTRICTKEATTFSLYCALERATDEVGGNFQHRGAAMQEARFLIDEITANRDYQHRLMDY